MQDNRYFGNTRAAKAVYGIILALVLLVGLDHITPRDGIPIAIKLLLGAISITIAEVYSEILGERISLKKTLKKINHQQIVKDAMAIITVTTLPVFIFLMSGLNFISIEIAFFISYGYFLIALFGFNYYAFTLSGSTKLRSFVYACATSLVGFSVIVIKYLFSH